MVRHIFKIAGIVFAVLLVLVIGIVFVLPKTGVGHGLIDRFSRPAIENVVEAQLGSNIEYDRIRGALPGEIIIEDVRLSQNGEAWLEVERLTVDWSPLALLRRKIEIERVEGTTITLYRQPDMPERPEPQPEEENAEPFSLPSISVDTLDIGTLSLREPLLGERYDLKIAGGGRAVGQKVDLAATVDTVEDTDSVRVNISYDGRTLTTESSILSAPVGLITTAIGAEDTVWLNLEGNGPLDDWQGTIDAQAGNYGALAGSLGGNLRTLENASFVLDVAPGSLAPEVAATLAGDSLHLDGSTVRDGDRVTITIAELSARFGDLSGTVILPDGDARRVEADIDGTLSEAVAADYSVQDLAGAIALDANVTRGEETIEFEGRLDTVAGTLTIAEGKNRPGTLFEGRIALDAETLPLENENFAAVLEGGAVIRSYLRVSEDLEIFADEIDGIIGKDTASLSVSGSASYAVETKVFDAALDGAAGPDAAAALLGRETFSEPVRYEVSTDGTPDSAAARLNVRFPSGEIDGNTFAAGTLDADLTGLPLAPRGRINLQSANQSYRGTVRLVTEGQTIGLRELSFTGGTLTVIGTGSYDREAGSGTADLRVDATSGTTLITGQTLAGSLTIDGAYTGEGGRIDLDAAATDFAFGSIDIPEGAIEANGPLSGLSFTLTGRDMALPSLFLARADIAGTADVESQTRRIDLSRMVLAVDADTDETRITLNSPTSVTLSETITVAPTSLDWLGGGSVELSATYGPRRWAADVQLSDVGIPRLYAPVSGTITLDTDNDIPAIFDLSSTVTPEDADQSYVLNASGRWTGTNVDASATFREADVDPIVEAEVSWPVMLQRTGDTISVVLPDEAISGTITADGDIDPIYTFVPAIPPYLTGELDGRFTLTGTSRAPGAEGTLALADGRFEDTSIGVVMTDLQGSLDAAYRGDGLSATLTMTGSGADGRDGALDIQGTIDITEDTSAIDTRLVLNDATIVSSPTLRVRTGADITLSGSLQEMTLAGQVDIGQIDAAIPDTGGNSESAASYTDVNVVRVDAPEEETTETKETPEAPLVIALDLDINAPNEIFIRGKGLDSEWAADLTITGTTADPQIDGNISNRRGTFEFAGRTFDIDRGRVLFAPVDTTLARLDVRASYDADDLTAFVNVTGPVSDPEISLSSTPSRPQEDIMAIVLFGKQPTELSALESLQIANALRSLAGIGPSIGGGGGIGLQSALGLDALSFGVDDETGEGVVAVGKYLSDDVYVSARQSAGGTSSEITVTYEFTDDITIESTLEPNGAQDVSVNYKRDY